MTKAVPFWFTDLHSSNDNSRSWVLLTGATGLLGSAVLKELLARGHHVLCVVRASAPAEARQRLAASLMPWEVAADRLLEKGQLAILRGDLQLPQLGLSTAVVRRLGAMVGSVVHAAGSTAFSIRTDANLVRTNVDGPRHLFELAGVIGCMDWHLFSTAYVCGKCASAEEVLPEAQPIFRNEYEWTKWTAEHEAQSAARRLGATLTTYRPSVIVGHSETGVITRFSGIYRVFRAVALLARAAEQRGDFDRHSIPLRIPADESACPNLVFVDDVVREFAELFSRQSARGGIFHLTHPDPPSNRAIQTALEQYYDIGGGRFIGAIPSNQESPRTAYEGIFFDAVLDTTPYVLESPNFDRTQTDRFVTRSPTPWNSERLRRQIHFAESSSWRCRKVKGKSAEDLAKHYSSYFEEFMPNSHRGFRLAQLSTLDLNVRYVIGRSAEGDWFCRYRAGRLVDVGRTNGIAPDVTYRIIPATFWSIVRGRSGAAEGFLSGEVQIEGDMERALKFAVILQDFVREFPYRPTVNGPHAT